MSLTTDHPTPRPLEGRFNRTDFDCGVPALNEYLEKYALQNQRKDASRTYVSADNAENILGYYTLVYGAISSTEAPIEISTGLGGYQIPIMLLARLAVDLRQTGRGLAGVLMRDAWLRTLQAAEIAGLAAVMVDAKDEQARSFYEKLGFRRSPDNPFKLFLQTTVIRIALQAGR